MERTEQRRRGRRSRATWPAAMLPGLLVLALVGTASGGLAPSSARDVEMVVSSVER